MRKALHITSLLAVLAACSAPSAAQNIAGTWSAVKMDASGQNPRTSYSLTISGSQSPEISAYTFIFAGGNKINELPEGMSPAKLTDIGKGCYKAKLLDVMGSELTGAQSTSDVVLCLRKDQLSWQLQGGERTYLPKAATFDRD